MRCYQKGIMDNIIWILIIVGFYAISTIIGWIARAKETARYQKILYSLEPQIAVFNFDKNYETCNDFIKEYEKTHIDTQNKYSLFGEENLDEILRKCIYLYNSGKAARRKSRSVHSSNRRRAWAGRF